MEDGRLLLVNEYSQCTLWIGQRVGPPECHEGEKNSSNLLSECVNWNYVFAEINSRKVSNNMQPTLTFTMS